MMKNPERNVIKWKVGSHGDYIELFNGNKVFSFKLNLKNINKQVQAIFSRHLLSVTIQYLELT